MAMRRRGVGGERSVTGETQQECPGLAELTVPKGPIMEGTQACEELALRHRDPIAMDPRGAEQKAALLLFS